MVKFLNFLRGIKSHLKALATPSQKDIQSLKMLRELRRKGYKDIGKSVIFEDYFSFDCQGNHAILSIDTDVHFKKYCHILIHENAQLNISKNVFFNNYCSINCLGRIEIGDNTLFGEGVKIYDHNHKYHYKSDQLIVERNEFTIGVIKIGKNSWIGSNVTILKDVEIGDNVIIGANNLIYKSVPSNTIIKAISEKLEFSYP